MTLRGRLLVTFGPAARTWRRAVRARRRAIVVVGRPVAAARGVWDGFVERVNGLGLSENTILVVFAVVVGVGGALGVVGFYKLIDAAYNLFYRWPETFLSRSDFLAYRPLVTATGFAAAWAVYRRFGGGVQGLNVPDVQLRVAPGRPDSHPPGARPHRRERDHDRRRRLGRQRGAGGGARLDVRLVARSDLPVRTEPGVRTGRRGGSRGHFRCVQRSARRRLLRPRGDPRLLRGGGILGGGREQRGGRGRVAGGVRQPPRLPHSGGVRVHAHARGGALLSAPGRRDGDGVSVVHLVLLPIGRLGAAAAGSRGGSPVDRRRRRGRAGLSVPRHPGRLWPPRRASRGVRANGVVLPPVARARQDPRDLDHAHDRGLGRAVHAFALRRRRHGGRVRRRAPRAVPRAAHPPRGLRARWHGSPGGRDDERADHGDPHRVRDDERGERIEHGSDRALLADLTVREAYDPSPQTFRADTPLTTLLGHLRPGEQTMFPVVDPNGVLLGVVTMADLARLAEDGSNTARLAADVAGPIEAVTLSDTLLEAIRRMGIRGTPALPVLRPGSHRLLGIVTRSHILAAYERALTGGGSRQGGTTKKG